MHAVLYLLVLGGCTTPSALQEPSSWRDKTVAIALQPEVELFSTTTWGGAGGLSREGYTGLAGNSPTSSKADDIANPVRMIGEELAALAGMRFGTQTLLEAPIPAPVHARAAPGLTRADLILEATGQFGLVQPHQGLPVPGEPRLGFTVRYYVQSRLRTRLIDVGGGRVLREQRCELDSHRGAVMVAAAWEADESKHFRRVMESHRDTCLAQFRAAFFDSRPP
jgi:hypothetical protein